MVQKLLNFVHDGEHHDVFFKALQVVQPSLYEDITSTGCSADSGETSEVRQYLMSKNEIPRLLLPLGSERFISIVEWQNEPRIDIRQFDGDNGKTFPTKVGVSLTLPRWKQLTEKADSVMKEVQKLVAEEEVKLFLHIGGNVHVSVNSGILAVDMRRWWLPEDAGTLKPTRKGISLRLFEWERLMKYIPIINEAIPELSSVVPCYLRRDHDNQESAMECRECNGNLVL